MRVFHFLYGGKPYFIEMSVVNMNQKDRLLSMIDQIDKTVHSPARLMILSYLSTVESCDLVFLMNQTGLTWGNLSSHMTKLEGEGYIVVQREIIERKPKSIIQITERGRQALLTYRKFIQEWLKLTT